MIEDKYKDNDNDTFNIVAPVCQPPPFKIVPFYDPSRAADFLEKDLLDSFEQVLTKGNGN